MPAPHSVTITATTAVTEVPQLSPAAAGGAVFPGLLRAGTWRTAPTVQTGLQISPKVVLLSVLRQSPTVHLDALIAPLAPTGMSLPPTTSSTLVSGSTPVITVSPASITVIKLYNPVQLTLQGSGISWGRGAVFTSSNPVALSIVGQTVTSETTALLTVIAGPPDAVVAISDGSTSVNVTVTTLDIAFTNALTGYMPDLYSSSQIMTYILTAQGNQLNALYQDIGLAANAAFVAISPDWGLDLWELELGITTDTTLTLTQRRATILQKLANGVTPTIKALIASLAQYKDGDVDVYEDFSTYTVYIQFLSKHGTPANLTALKAGVRAFIPAHLDIEYIFSFLTWSQLDAFNWTWSTLDGGNYTWTTLTNL